MPKKDDLGPQILSGKYTIRVVKSLLESPKNCTDVSEAIGADHVAIRYTLERLQRHGIVKSEVVHKRNRMDTTRQYSIVRPTLEKALQEIEATINNLREVS